MNMPRKSKYTLMLCCMGIFFTGCEFYFMVPFYPLEAAKKGMDQWVVGLVLASLHVVIFIFSPIFGNFLPKLGAKFTYLSGAFVGGVATLLFGLVDLSNPGAPFIVCSILCRSFVALGISAFVTAGFAILTNEFPNHMATAFGLAEVANGVGLMVAPAIGGALYEVGGFPLPFVFIGSLVLLNGIILYCVLPPPKSAPGARKGSILYMFRSPLFCVAIWNIFTSAIGMTFLDPTLGKRLEMYGLSPGLIGVCFLISPTLYAALSPVYGYLTDTKGLPATLTNCGMVVIALSYFFLGPVPQSGITTDFWLVIVCLVVLGIGFGATAVPIIKLMVTGAMELGFSDNLETYSIVSGGFYSASCAGGVVGNAVGGLLLDAYGFQVASLCVALLHVFTAVVSTSFFGFRKLRRMMKQRMKESQNCII